MTDQQPPKFDLVIFRDDFDRHVWCLALQAAIDARRKNAIELANKALRYYQTHRRTHESQENGTHCT